jgi:peptidyl-tRNA hydrolase
LYVITRKDLSPGQQAVQSMHALRQFVADHPEQDKNWFEKSNYLSLLSVDDESALHKLIEKAAEHNVRFSIFREPDIGDRVTAIALEPGTLSKKICRNLKLALG